MEFIIFITIWYAISKFVEILHYRSIEKREKKYLNLPVLSGYKMLQKSDIKDGTLVYAEVSLATDVFKRYVVEILSFFGLNIVVYEKLLDRARREAILRLKEKCLSFDAIINLKLDTVEICRTYYGANKRIKGMQVLVSGTAIHFNK